MSEQEHFGNKWWEKVLFFLCLMALFSTVICMYKGLAAWDQQSRQERRETSLGEIERFLRPSQGEVRILSAQPVLVTDGKRHGLGTHIFVVVESPETGRRKTTSVSADSEHLPLPGETWLAKADFIHNGDDIGIRFVVLKRR